MLVCSVSLRAPRRAIAADLEEAATAADATATGNVVFATLVDDPANVNDTVDAYLGEIMVEAASAADSLNAGLTYAVAIDEATTAADTQTGTTSTGPPIVTPTTWNPSDLASVTLTGGNLISTANSATAGVRGIAARNSGKYYWEATVTTANGSGTEIGISTASAALVGDGAAGQAVMTRAKFTSGAIWINGSNSGSALGSPAGATVGIAVDLSAGLIWFRLTPSGNWNGSGTANPATGVGGVSLGALTGSTFYPCFGGTFANDKMTANFGATAFNGSVPSGFASGWGL